MNNRADDTCVSSHENAKRHIGDNRGLLTFRKVSEARSFDSGSVNARSESAAEANCGDKDDG